MARLREVRRSKLASKAIVLMVLPALLLYTVFVFIPAVSSFAISLYDWNGFSKEMKFVGIQNYVNLVKDKDYWQSLRVTFSILLFGGIAIFVLSFLLTAFFSTGIKGRKFFRAVIFYPMVISPIALAIFWSFLYNPSFGLINGVLRALGLDSLALVWTGRALIFRSVLVALVWTDVGFFFVLLLAGAERIPQDFYDVAKVEGANRFRTFFTVTIPLIWEVLYVAIVFWVITALKVFEFLFAFTGGSTVPRQLWSNSVYMVLLTFGRQGAFYRLGYGTAVAVFLVVVLLVLVGIVRLVMLFRENVEY
jgi:ABC-type sugar transport system permease subunit